MLLNQLVKINETALVANAVTFELMEDKDKNLRLCQGFVFNYESDPKKINSSTVGVLRALRNSFHSPSEPNVHLMVQDYGKGKSHFALAVANFFQKPYDSEEVRGVLQQIEYATSASSPILEDLKQYKKRGRNLVICLSGDKPIDLHKHFLKAVKKTLEAEEIVSSLGQQVCRLPLEYLENLTPEQRQEAEEYLSELGNPEGDIDSIIQLLRDDNYEVISLVKEISRKLTRTGIPLDFETNVDIEAILADLITNFCMGVNPRYQGILILFDELYNYLQMWASDPVRAGSTALQNITNICERFKGKIALLSLTQRRPGRVTPLKNVEDYNRLVSRLELLPSTYEPAASLELVLNSLLKQEEKTAAWQEFLSKWRSTLLATNTTIFQKRTANYYQNRNWTDTQFFQNITVGCYPLHPLTSYLLCNLDFTQGRTAIQFVQEDVKRFIQEQTVENNSSLNLIYPVALVDAFESNFANPEANSEYSSLYSNYNNSATKVKASADADRNEMLVLKALLLFYASRGKLTKLDRERHEDILSLLTGLSATTVKLALDKLCQIREVIFLNEADNTYCFYSGGFGIDELRRRIKEETANKSATLESVARHCQLYIDRDLGGDTTPTRFIESNRLCSEDWCFQNKVFTVTKLKQTLSGKQTVKSIDTSGIVAYVIGESAEELLALRREVSQVLEHSPVKGQVVVAISSQPIEKLARLLQENSVLEKKSVQDFGAAVSQLKQQYQKQILDTTSEIFKSSTYHCYIEDKIPTSDRNYLSPIVSAVLQEQYPFVPPVDKVDKMALKSSAGSEVISFVSKRLLENDLRPQAFPRKSYENVVNPVFVNSWRLLKATSQKYSVVVPSHRNIRVAWDKISEITDLGDKTENSVEIVKIWETLSRPPYGYNEYTFTILFTAWLAYHRAEVSLKGGFGIPQKKSEMVQIRTEPLKNWASTNVFDKPKDFVNIWIKNGRTYLIRRLPVAYPEVPNSINWEQARQFIQDIENYLSNPSDPTKVSELKTTQDKLRKGVARLEQLMEPVVEVDNLLQINNFTQTDIETLLLICSQLQEPLSVIAEDNLSICPTAQQTTKHGEAMQAAIEKIGQFLEVEKARSQSLNTQAECGAYKANIQRLLERIRLVSSLPIRFLETLQSAIQASDIRLAEIEEQAKVNNYLERIENLYRSLSTLATQNEYVDIQNQIESLVISVPSVRETSTYRNIIQSLEEKQNELFTQIAAWEDRFTSSLSLIEAMHLSQSINRQLNRFNDESRQRLNNLLERLNRIVLERQNEEQSAERIHNLLDDGRQYLQNITNNQDLFDAFKAYQELTQLSFSFLAGFVSLEEQQVLEQLKSEGYTVISHKFSQVFEDCQQPIQQESKYNELKKILQKLRDIVFRNEQFSGLHNNFEEASRNLERQYEEWQKKQQDRKTLESIRQYTIAKTNTISLCEEALEAIAILQNNLNSPEQFTQEINKLLKQFRDKAIEYKNNLQNLRDRLSQLETSQQINQLREEYAKLDFVFKDSTEYPTYQQLQTQINLVLEDLEHLRHWENLYQQSQSIAACDRTLATLADGQANLHNIERFRPKFQKWQEQLLQRKQGYIGQLDELQRKLPTIKTLKEAQKLQGELATKLAYYRESQEEQRYQAICAEVSLLIELLQISTIQKLDTIAACQAERERLLQWRQHKENMTPTVQTVFDSMLTNLNGTQQQIENQQKEAAKIWLDNLETQSTRLEEYTNASKKLTSANELYKQIRQQKRQHEGILEPEQKQILEQMINLCVEIQNQDTESQIITLFERLPRKKQEGLLKKLEGYLK
ncbi:MULTISPECIES: hypothetical protein [Nostocales]|nr:hypothetical protein [Tolypothrix bouteillei]KAF3886501.1 hypothetical protein DA73_0400014190 [Tolypothrix bouteillei VB521301]